MLSIYQLSSNQYMSECSVFLAYHIPQQHSSNYNMLRKMSSLKKGTSLKKSNRLQLFTKKISTRTANLFFDVIRENYQTRRMYFSANFKDINPNMENDDKAFYCNSHDLTKKCQDLRKKGSSYHDFTNFKVSINVKQQQNDVLKKFLKKTWELIEGNAFQKQAVPLTCKISLQKTIQFFRLNALDFAGIPKKPLIFMEFLDLPFKDCN